MQHQSSTADELGMVSSWPAVSASDAWWREPEAPTIIGSLDSQVAVIEAELMRWRRANAALRVKLRAILLASSEFVT